MKKSIFEISKKISELSKITILELDLEIPIYDHEYMAFLLTAIIEQNSYENEEISRKESNYSEKKVKEAFEVAEKIYENRVSYINLRGKDSLLALKLLEDDIKELNIIIKNENNVLLSLANNDLIDYKNFRYLNDLNLTFIYLDAFNTRLITAGIESDYYDASYTFFIYREIIRKLGFSLYEFTVATLIYQLKKAGYQDYFNLFKNGDTVFINSLVDYNELKTTPEEYNSLSNNPLLDRVINILRTYPINKVKNFSIEYIEKVIMKHDI